MLTERQAHDLARFHEWIVDPDAITIRDEKLELLETILNCPYELPEMYRKKLGLPRDATYHDAAQHLLRTRFPIQTNFTLRSMLAAVASTCAFFGLFRWLPFGFRLMERNPLAGIIVGSAIAFAVTLVVVGLWKLAGKLGNE